MLPKKVQYYLNTPDKNVSYGEIWSHCSPLLDVDLIQNAIQKIFLVSFLLTKNDFLKF